MTLIFPVILIIVMLLIIALLSPLGLWGNAIMFINVVTAALLATNFWEPLAGWLKQKAPSGVFLWDIVALWLLFALILFALRTATEFASKFKVKFDSKIEMIGKFVFATWTSWVVICFLTMTLHTAPLGREFVLGGFKAESPMFFGFYPDRLWLGVVQRFSLGSFGSGGTAKDPEAHVFDPHGEFMLKYAERRSRFEQQSGLFAAGPGAN